ncbi:MAG TPA: tetratricopeptide repeat protein [Candidatus Sulfotelmatobacter sp.]|nr:tetratricopeptide repeat protein [Candidatus Sulfotelmatobacter sp.]
MGTTRLVLWGLVLALGGAVVAATPGWAQTAAEVSNDAELQKAYDDAFAAMMAEPQNLDKTFAFAELAAKKGDLEGAISALERMLFINPDLPRVKLELGVLYFRLGSYETARAYLQEALQANPPAAVRERAQSFLDEIDRQSSVHRFFGSVYGGLRVQSNANASPSGTNVMAVGLPSTLSSLFTKRVDANIFGAANAKYIYDLQDQNQDTIEVTGSFYGARQSALQAFNITFFEMTAGPRFPIPSSWLWEGGALSVKPYALYDYIDLHDDDYYRAPGAGFEVLSQIQQGTVAQFNFEVRDKHYKDTGLIPISANQTGREMLGHVQLTQAITDQIAMLAGGTYQNTDAQGDTFAPSDQAYHYYDWTLGGSYSFAGPRYWSTQSPWNMTLTVTRAYYIYRQPDPSVDPFDTRFDRDWRFALVSTVPITDSWNFITTFGYTQRESSITNYKFNDTYGSVGASWRF